MGLRPSKEGTPLEVRLHGEEGGALVREEVEHLVVRHRAKRCRRHEGFTLEACIPASIDSLDGGVADGLGEHRRGFDVHS